ncbi:MAG: Rrf2 family transcriptional regulator [Eubacteriaceae bacterium]|jgi:Rrf2 family protein|nr:Rrf2 family transcriptional regulator [Eubacteriaceae bacterium]
MQISSRFTIALHILTCIDTFKDDYKITSDFLAESVNVNPVVIRRLLQQLKAAGLVNVKRGSGGAEIARPLEEITMLDVYRAVDSVDGEGLFHFHENPNPNCPVGRNIHNVLDGRLNKIQDAMEEEMKKTTIADIVKDTQKCISKQ